MSVRVEYDKDAKTYSLGDDIEGVFIPFVVYPAETVEGRIATANAVAADAGAAVATAPGKVAGDAGDDFDAADFTDNGDGTFTRTSDNVQGRFTPGGFEPVTTP